MTRRFGIRRSLVAASMALGLIGCGGGGKKGPADLCGNGVVDSFERCDDGNQIDDDGCNNDCQLSCGDGRLGASEACDTAIPEGEPGACPTACDDGDACTDDTITGEMCQQTCDFQPIDYYRDGDGCCPNVTGANAFNDFDCAPECGNGVVEMGETCDTAITAGNTGACPDATLCDDGVACTTDTIVTPPDDQPGDGACRATCEHTVITAADGTGGDGCCPANADNTTDADCPASCGNGQYNPGLGETCDDSSANNKCPTSCTASADPCIDTVLVSAGTCKAECAEIENRQPTNDDMCCPVFWGGNNRNDNDCTSSCGTPAEECDTPGEGSCDTDCRIVRTAYRVTSISIQDPHIFWDLGNGNCPDLTSVVNTMTIPDAIVQDQDGDGFADLTWLHVFIPLDQAGATNRYELVYAQCLPSADPADTQCVADPLTERVASTANNMTSGSCLDVLPDTTTTGYATPPTTPSAPCFVTDALNIDLELGDLIVPLESGYISAEYDGDPATGLINGLLRGFVSEATAEATVLPMSIPILGGKKLSEILAGGIAPGSCNVTTNPVVAIGDDRDLGPDGTTMGWYFYVNFTAAPVPYEDKPNASSSSP